MKCLVQYLAAMSLVLFTITGCSEQSSLQALGVLERDRIVLTATSSEIITALPVKEGTAVDIGDLLVQLDDRTQKPRVQQARGNLEQAQALLRKLENGSRPEDITTAKARVTGALADLKDATQNYTRILDLVNRQALSQSDLDQAIAVRDTARADLDALRSELAALENGSRPEDIDHARATVVAAQAHLDTEQAILNDLSIRSTRAGFLNELPYKQGERVESGNAVAVLFAGSAPYARIYVPETRRIDVHVNDTLTVHVDGADSPFQGKVRWISSDPAFTPYYALNAEDRSRLMYMAEIQLDESAGDLPTGLPVQVDIPR